MKKTLVYGHNSFIAKNFVDEYSDKFKFFFFKKKYNSGKKIFFENELKSFLKVNKIEYLINFAANNDNSNNFLNFDKILESNFYLPISLIKICSELKITLVLFLSKDMANINQTKNLYSLSKKMLHTYIISSENHNKLRIFDIDSVFGPNDLNTKRIISAISYNLFSKDKKKAIKIENLNQSKKFIFVKKLNKVIFKNLFIKKKFLLSSIKSEKYNLKDLIRIANKVKKNENLKSIKKKQVDFLNTFKWYKDYYGEK